MLSEIVDVLECPQCGGRLRQQSGSLRCENRHSYDVARQGYVSLLAGDVNLGSADTASMVEARERFLATGAFEPIAAAVAATVVEQDGSVPGVIVDVGAGTGYYLAAALRAVPARQGVALDLSKYAARRSARAHAAIGSVVCDAWRCLPVRSAAAAVVLDVFSPRNPAEMARVLHPQGTMVIVTPTQRHLRELVETLGMIEVDETKDDRLEAAMSPYFTRLSTVPVERHLLLTPEATRLVALMGPSARHLDPAKVDATIAGLPETVRATLSVVVSTYRPLPASGRR